MKNGALTFAFLIVAGAAGGVAFVGCSSDPAADPVTVDAGADTTPVDTGKAPTDTNPPDTRPVSCAIPIDSSFKCEPPIDRKGQTVCTDEMIEEFMNCFGTEGDAKKCTAAQTKFPQCNACILKDWLNENSIDQAACIKKIDPAGTCATTVNCATDCLKAVCGECDDTAGSGKSATRSEQQDCESDAQFKGSSTRPKGACYDVALAAYPACKADPRFTPCFISTLADVKYFFRGACRDNAVWTDVLTDKPTAMDGGVDSATDAPVVVDSAADGG